MKESTMVMVMASAAGQPILWTEHPRAALGDALFFGLAAAMCIGFLVGLVMWARQGMFQLAEEVSQSQQTTPK